MIKTIAVFLVLTAPALGQLTQATSSGDAVYTGPDAPDSDPHPFAIQATFSADFLSAHVVLSGDTAEVWDMEWVGMDEASRRFYDTLSADAQLILTGADFELITDTPSFLTNITGMGFQYFDPAYNLGSNLTTDLAGSAAPTAIDVPEPYGIFALQLAFSFCLALSRKTT